MKRSSILLSLIAVSAMAGEPKPLDALLTELRSQSERLPVNRSLPERLSGEREQAILDQILSSKGDLPLKEAPEAIRALTRLQVITHSSKLEELCAALIAALRERAAEKSKDLQTRYRSLAQDILYKGLDSTSPEELVALRADLARFQQESEDLFYRPEIRDLINFRFVRSAGMMLDEYQKGLLSWSNPETRGRWDSRAMLQSAQWGAWHLPPFMARSEFMEKALAAARRISPKDDAPNRPQTADDKLWHLTSKIKTLDNLESISRQADALGIKQTRTDIPPGKAQVAVERLHSMQKVYQKLDSGNHVRPEEVQSCTHGYEISDYGVLNAGRMLILFAVSRLIESSSSLGHRNNEDVADFMRRVLAMARERRDWKLYSRTLDVAAKLNIDAVANSYDHLAFKNFMTGLEKEMAEDYRSAVSFYFDSAQSKSQWVPVDDIARRVDAIREKSPAAYSAGIELAKSRQIQNEAARHAGNEANLERMRAMRSGRPMPGMRGMPIRPIGPPPLPSPPNSK